MIRVSDAVEQILIGDRTALEAIQRNFFNASSYAKQIHTAVAERTMKEVQIGTIVVSINRLLKRIQAMPLYNPNIKLNNFSVSSQIAEVTYEKTTNSIAKIALLESSLLGMTDFYTLTHGLHEITILCNEDHADKVIEHFNQKPKIYLKNLVAISVRFSPEYINIPNTIYSLVGLLATKHINLIEIVSTYTELTFIIHREEMEAAIALLSEYSQETSMHAMMK